jgi:hypothetical protein
MVPDNVGDAENERQAADRLSPVRPGIKIPLPLPLRDMGYAAGQERASGSHQGKKQENSRRLKAVDKIIPSAIRLLEGYRFCRNEMSTENVRD